MSTDRPKIVVYSDNEALEKLKYIADKYKRSVSNLCDIIIHEYIESYENKNGNIEIVFKER